MPLTKVEALNAWTNLINTYELGLASLALVGIIDPAALKGRKIDFQIEGKSVGHMSLDSFAKTRGDPVQWAITCTEFDKSIKRTVLRDAHEIITWYANESGQFPTYQAAPWYQFARVVRNALSHENVGVFRFEERVKKKLPATWRHMTIDVSMEGKELLIGVNDVMTLLGDMGSFLENALK